jgi:excisionase family DNA binding protein
MKEYGQIDPRLETAIRELVAAMREEIRAESQAQYRAAAAGPPRLFSLKQAAEMFDLSRTAFYGLIQAGEIRSFKVGGRRLVAESDLREYIDRRRGEPPD